jgi:hypothetical protein
MQALLRRICAKLVGIARKVYRKRNPVVASFDILKNRSSFLPRQAQDKTYLGKEHSKKRSVKLAPG